MSYPRRHSCRCEEPRWLISGLCAKCDGRRPTLEEMEEFGGYEVNHGDLDVPGRDPPTISRPIK